MKGKPAMTSVDKTQMDLKRYINRYERGSAIRLNASSALSSY
jgi:hypothetical protein